MPKRVLRRALIVAVSPSVAIAFLLASTTTASAHEVTNIVATCDTVTVFFSGFPESGVPVHIAATVEEALAEVEGAPARDLDDLVEADAEARRLAGRGLPVA